MPANLGRKNRGKCYLPLFREKSSVCIRELAYGPQPHPPPQQPPPPRGGKGPIDVGISLPPLVMDAKTEIARLAGCSQLGQSAPVEFIDCNCSNLLSQVGQRYS